MIVWYGTVRYGTARHGTAYIHTHMYIYTYVYIYIYIYIHVYVLIIVIIITNGIIASPEEVSVSHTLPSSWEHSSGLLLHSYIIAMEMQYNIVCYSILLLLHYSRFATVVHAILVLGIRRCREGTGIESRSASRIESSDSRSGAKRINHTNRIESSRIGSCSKHSRIESTT